MGKIDFFIMIFILIINVETGHAPPVVLINVRLKFPRRDGAFPARCSHKCQVKISS